MSVELLSLSVAALTSGAANSILTRLLLAAPCAASCSADGVSRPLAAPLFASLLAFAAMSLSLLAVRPARCVGPRAARARYVPLLLPTLLDVASTVLASASVLFVAASTSGALRGSLLLFTAVGIAACRARGEGAPSHGEWAGAALSATGAEALATGATRAKSCAASPRNLGHCSANKMRARACMSSMQRWRAR